MFINKVNVAVIETTADSKNMDDTSKVKSTEISVEAESAETFCKSRNC